MSVPNPSSSRVTAFYNPPPFPVSHHVCDYRSYLHAKRLTDIRASGRVLNVRDRYNIVLRYWCRELVKHRLRCSCCGMSVLRCVLPWIGCPFQLCSEEFEYEKSNGRLCDASMSRCYPNLFPLSSFCVVHSVAYTFPSDWTTGRVTGTLNIVLDNMLVDIWRMS